MINRLRSCLGVAAILTLIVPNTATAIEGGTGTYLLGGRDSFMGIVPGPGTYISNEMIFINADGPSLNLAGIAVATPSYETVMYRLSATHVFKAQILGGTPALNITQHYAWGELTVDGVIGSNINGRLTDKANGFSDTTVTPLIGWHDGNLHYSLGATIYLPTGLYGTADVTVGPPPSIDDALNFGKNRFAVDPTFAVTWFNPMTGLQINGALGVTFSAKNDATGYQSAPELHFEGSIIQQFANGFALGAAGYAYTQLGEDSGSGADTLRAILGAGSLRAEVFGIGPVASYTTKIGNSPVTFKAKYFHEFEARNRFEADVFWVGASFSF
jgi:hypothetical protein